MGQGAQSDGRKKRFQFSPVVLWNLRTREMNQVGTQFTVSQQEASLAHGEIRARQNMTAGVPPVVLEELIHDIRQPLGAIDSLAYFLELTSIDEQACTQLKRIRAMVVQANRILEQSARSSRKQSAANQDLVRC